MYSCTPQLCTAVFMQEADGNSTNTSSSEARPLLNRGVSHGGVPSQVNSTPRESGRDSQLLPVAGSEIHEDTEVALTQSPSTHDHLSSPDLLSMQEQPPGPPLAESSFIDHKAPPPAKSSEDESNVDSSPDELPLAIGPVPTQTGSPGESTPPASPPPTGSPGESTPPASVSLSTKTYSSAAVLSNLPLESSPQAALSTAKTHQIPSANNEGMVVLVMLNNAYMLIHNQAIHLQANRPRIVHHRNHQHQLYYLYCLQRVYHSLIHHRQAHQKWTMSMLLMIHIKVQVTEIQV